MRKSGVELRKDYTHESMFCHGRASELSQVFVNLIINACDAVAPLPTKWIEVTLKAEERSVVVSVTDSGSGIPVEIVDKIMQPFFTTKPTGKGTGLGLSITKSIVDEHKGVFEVDRACANTRFVVKLPRT